MFMYPSTDCNSPIATVSVHTNHMRDVPESEIDVFPLTSINDARIQLNGDWIADDIREKSGRILALALGGCC